mgnify:CR=1 FL=1
MVIDDWTYCPNCEFPALFSHMSELLGKTGQCPMCSHDIDVGSLVLVPDPSMLLRGQKKEIAEETAS